MFVFIPPMNGVGFPAHIVKEPEKAVAKAQESFYKLKEVLELSEKAKTSETEIDKLKEKRVHEI